jgi:hypothetical protein
MKLVNILGGLLMIFGGSITLTTPFILLVGFGMLDIPPDILPGIEITLFSALLVAVVVFIVGYIIVVIGKLLWERE